MAELLKNIFFTPQSITHLSETIKKVHPRFDELQFKNCVYSGTWEELELKQKMRHISTCLHQHLPENYIEALEILEKIAPMIKGFDAMALPDFVEQHGLDYFDRSLEALALFTRYSSSEFAIRPFLIKDLDKTIQFMTGLTESDQEWVRRFASEGCRPRLPWAQAVQALRKDPAPVLAILEKLKDDPSESVRRSVANNLNDISRDHPDLVTAICRKWMNGSAGMDKLIKHALRTLLKNGNENALKLFRFTDPGQIEIISLTMGKTDIPIGEKTAFEVAIKNNNPAPEKLRIEYGIYYRKANGGFSKKIFHIAERNYDTGTHIIRRKLYFGDMTTRKHYPGEHQLSIIINGRELFRMSFFLSQG